MRPWHILTDDKGFESIVESDEDGEPKGDLVCHVFGDHAALLRDAPELRETLRLLVTRAQMEMRFGKLPAEWGDGVMDRARALVEG